MMPAEGRGKREGSLVLAGWGCCGLVGLVGRCGIAHPLASLVPVPPWLGDNRGSEGHPRGDRDGPPKTDLQLCIVRMIRDSMRYVPRKERRKVAADLKTV